jgi:hypothetical protein
VLGCHGYRASEDHRVGNLRPSSDNDDDISNSTAVSIASCQSGALVFHRALAHPLPAGDCSALHGAHRERSPDCRIPRQHTKTTTHPVHADAPSTFIAAAVERISRLAFTARCTSRHILDRASRLDPLASWQRRSATTLPNSPHHHISKPSVLLPQ